MNKIWTTLARVVLVSTILLFVSLPNSSLLAQNDDPCDCTLRWEDGSDWVDNGDGTFSINDNSNGTGGGIVRCGNSAETHSNIQSNCTYDDTAFDLTTYTDLMNCINPGTGATMQDYSANFPTNGQAITWFNFDVRAFAGTYEFQIVNNSNDLRWVLFYSNTVTMPPPDGTVSGDCMDLTFATCGNNFTGWADEPFVAPIIDQATNYYLMVWDATGGSNFKFNFKARFGCGDGDVKLCSIEAGTPTISCDSDNNVVVTTHIMGINGEFIGTDGAITSNTVCLTNLGEPTGNQFTEGDIIMVYPPGTTSYNITIQAQGTPSASCDFSLDANQNPPYDVTNCNVTVTGNISLPTCSVDPTDHTQPTCDNPNDGATIVTVSGGMANYDVSWANADNSVTGSSLGFDGVGGLSLTGLPGGMYTVTVVDANGCSTTCMFTLDTPTNCCEFDVTCPNNLDLGDFDCNTLANIPAAPTTVADLSMAPYNITIGNNPCGTIEFTSVDSGTPNVCTGQIQTITRTITIWDDLAPANGILDMGEEFETCIFSLDIIPDTQTPTFDSQPGDISDIACNASLPTQETLTASDNCGTASVVPSVDNYTPDVCNGYSVTYRWTATDACGNTAQVTKSFSVLPDNQGPTFDSSPSDISDINCSDAFPTQETLTATDDCGNATVVPSVDNYTPDQCNGYLVTYRWTATDDCGNSSVVTKSFNVLPDTQGPAFDSQPGNISDIACNGTLPTQETLTATDACGGTTSVTPSVDNYTPDVCNGFMITYRWTATDDCGNSSVVTKSFNLLPDTQAPTFDSQPGDISDIACNASLPTQETLTATDDCGNASVVPSVDPYTNDQCTNTTVTYRWVAADDCGNSAVVTKSFQILADTEVPTFDSQPADIADIACDAALPTQETLTAMDNCGNGAVVPSVDPYTNDQCSNTTVTYRWTATDDCGNSAVVTKSFSVLPDTQGPVFDSQPGDISDIDCDDTFPTQETLTASDDCGNATVVPSVDNYTPDQCNGYSVTYRWVATDDCGNSSVVTKSFNVLPDTQAPTFDSAPGDIADINCNDALPTQETLTATDACGGTTSVTPSVDPYQADQCGTTMVTYRWVASDDCGNTAVTTKSFNILGDSNGITFDSQPADIADIACNDALPTQETLTASDDCGIATVVPSVDPYTNDQCSNTTVTYRWTATDACGNTLEVTKSFQILADTQGPSFVSQPSDIADINCDDPLPGQETLTAIDNCSAITVVPSVDPFSPDVCNGYTVTHRWTATDDCGNSSVVTKSFNVLPDTQGPTFDSQPSDIADINCDDPLPGQETLTAIDNCSAITVVPSVDNYTPDQCNGYSVTYRWVATDACGNTAVTTKSFNVLPDTQAPTFVSQPSDIADINCDDPFPTQETLMASDDCSSTVQVTPSVDNYTPDQCNGYTVTYRWVATDACGNTTQVTKSFNVLPDTQGPTFDSQPGDLADIDCNDPFPTQETLTASDDCSNTVQITPSVDSYTPDQCNGYSVTYRWVATDACGNTTQVTKSFNVLPDTQGPTFDSQPGDLADIDCNDPFPTQETLTASDDCSGTVQVTPSIDHYTEDVCAGYTVTYRWIATDDCGNTTQVTKSFNVLPDTAPPAVTCPANLTVSCEDSTHPNDTGYASCADDCGGGSTPNNDCPVDERPTHSGGITPDGNTGDWNIPGDFFANMYRAGKTDKPVESKLYIRYDCNTQTMCALVLVEPGVVALMQPDDAFIKLGNSNKLIDGNDVGNGFEWVYNGSGTLIGFEACVTLAPGSYTNLNVHLQVFSDGESQTSAVADRAIPICLETCDSNGGGGNGNPINPTFTDNIIPGNCDNEYVIERTWVCTDACGNSASCMQTITVVDNTPPSISCPGDRVVECGDSTSPDELGEATGSDNCGTPTVGHIDDFDPACGNTGVITRTWTVTDACGNTNTCVQTITIVDTTPPVFDSQPGDISDIDCNDPLPTQETLTASDICSNTVTVTPSVDNYTPDQCNGYTVTYRWVATDDCGNTTQATKSFNVLPDTQGPTFDSQPGDLADIDCNDPFPTQETLTASDDCSSTVQVTPSVDNYTPDQCNGYTVTYRWVATDACGNTAVTTKSFNVLPDTQSPTFDSSPMHLSDINCDDPFPLQETLTASDDCSSTVQVTPSVDNYTPDQCNGYTVTYRWVATDDCGNTAVVTRSFDVLPDTQSPTFDSQPGDLADIDCNDPFPTQETLTASDDCSNTVQVTPSVDPYTVDVCEGYSVTYRWVATDDCGNTAVTTKSFNVLPDTQAPEFDSAPQPLGSIACNTSFPEQETLTASDDCSAVTVTPSVDPFFVDVCNGYNVTYRWTATDACGNSSVVTRVLTVLPDTQAPSFTSTPGQLTDIRCNAPFPQQETLNAVDDCSTVTVTPSIDPYTIDPCNGYAVTYRWVATDACGNSSVVTRVFNVLPDTQAPEFEIIPAFIADIRCNAPFPQQETVTAVDNCNNVSVTPSVDSYTVDICNGYAVTYRWVATDDCGNSSVITRTFNVLPDTQSPTFDSQPGDLADIDCNESLPIQETLTASDDCSAVSVTPSVDPYTIDICNGYAVTYRWVATDACGNSSVTTRTFNVLPDTQLPTFDSQPGDLADIDCNEDLPVQETLTASDNCSSVTVMPSVDPYIEDVCNGYAITYRWVATDACGNSSVATRTFNVRPDTDAPTFDDAPPSTVTINCDEPLPPFTELSASDDCSAVTVTSSVDPYTVDVCNGYTVIYRWTATDACGNSASTTQTITVLPDTEAPQLTPVHPDLANIPQGGEVFVQCNTSDPNWDPFVFTADDMQADDDCSDVTVVLEDVLLESSNDCEESGFLSRYRCTWTATDACGNTAEFWFIMTIVDTQAPTLIGVPANTTASCDAIPHLVQVTTEDNCGNATISFNENIVDGACSGEYTIFRTWTATDQCGNSSSKTQTISVYDNTAPILNFWNPDLAGYSNGDEIFIDCNDENPFDFSPTDVVAVDFCDTYPQVELDIKISESTNCAAYGYVYTIIATWTATDDCGNESEMVLYIRNVDNTPPVLHGVPDAICSGSVPAPADVTATDDCSSVSVTMEDSLPEPCEDGGTYILRTWTATDECGNVSEASQVIITSDGTGPEISLTHPLFDGATNGGIWTIEADCNEENGLAQIGLDDISIADNCYNGADVTIHQELVAEGDCATDGYLYQIQLRIEATDFCGNTGLFALTVNVVDSTAPEFGENPSEVDAECGAELIEPNATDACSDVTITYSDTDHPSELCNGSGSFMRTWVATDACGNTSSFVQQVNIIDTTAPELVGVPADACGTPGNVPDVTATDACTDTDVAVQFSETTISSPCGDVIARTWTATDACGNEASQTQYITNTDNAAPSIEFNHPLLTGVSNGDQISVECDYSGYPLNIPGLDETAVIATDDCSPNTNVEFELGLMADGNCHQDGYIALYRAIWTATDPCGNMTMAVVMIAVTDNVAPVLVGVPYNAIVYCDNNLEEPNVYALDNCAEVDVILSESYVEGALIRTWTATDACGNTASESQHIQIIEGIAACNFSTSRIIYCGTLDNELTVSPHGGTAPYSYSWVVTSGSGSIVDGADEATVVFASGFNDLVFEVTVTDANGCSTTCSYTIECEKKEEDSIDEEFFTDNDSNEQGSIDIMQTTKGSAYDMTLYPNPTKDELFVKFDNLELEENGTVLIYDVYGKLIYTEKIEAITNTTYRLGLNAYPGGVYTLMVKFDDHQTKGYRFIISE